MPKLAPNPIEVRFTLPPEGMPARPDLVIADHLGPIAMRELGASGLQVFCAHPGPEVDWSSLAGLDQKLNYDLSIPAKKELSQKGIKTTREAMVVGSDAIGSLENIGPKMVDRLRDGIRRQFPILRLLRKPTPAYATVFCRDLTEVPLAAVYCANIKPGPAIFLQDILDRADVVQSRGLSPATIEAIFDRTVKFAGDFNRENSSKR